MKCQHALNQSQGGMCIFRVSSGDSPCARIDQCASLVAPMRRSDPLSSACEPIVMDTWAIVLAVVGAVLSALFGVFLFAPIFDWMKRKLLRRRRLIIETAIEPGRTTREYGFAEPGIKVKFVNAGGDAVGIQDVRLIFSKGYGLPLPVEAPPPRSHPTLPVTIGGGCTVIWYFPAQAASRSLRSLASPRQVKRGDARLRVVLTGNDGRTYTGPWLCISLDQNSLWHL